MRFRWIDGNNKDWKNCESVESFLDEYATCDMDGSRFEDDLGNRFVFFTYTANAYRPEVASV